MCFFRFPWLCLTAQGIPYLLCSISWGWCHSCVSLAGPHVSTCAADHGEAAEKDQPDRDWDEPAIPPYCESTDSPHCRHRVSSIPSVARHWTHIDPHITILSPKHFLASTRAFYPRLDWISFRKTNCRPFSSKEKGRHHQEFVIGVFLGRPISYPLCLNSCN